MKDDGKFAVTVTTNKKPNGDLNGDLKKKRTKYFLRDEKGNLIGYRQEGD